MDLIIPLGPDIARFDDRNLYLRTSPEDMADALSRVGPADLRTIAQASPEVASAGLEAVIEALESSDTLDGLERVLSLLDRLKGAARSYLTERQDGQIYVGREALPLSGGYRVLTADERARIVAAVGDAPTVVPAQMVGNVPTVTVTGHLDGLISAETPNQDSGEALVGVECYVWDSNFSSRRVARIQAFHEGWTSCYRVRGNGFRHARPVALGRFE